MLLNNFFSIYTHILHKPRDDNIDTTFESDRIYFHNNLGEK